jgi:hypothetical protein
MPNGYYFVSHTIEQQTVFFAGFDRSYDQISMQFNIHRRSTYFIRLINWPGSILILLTLTIFFLPPTASERIIYGNSFQINYKKYLLIDFRCIITYLSIYFINNFCFLYSKTTWYIMAMDGTDYFL